MALRKAERRKAKARIGLSGVPGSGKTYSALKMARGLVDSWEEVAIIDTENGSADLYAHLGGYNVLPLQAPFAPKRYIEAIKECEDAGMKVIIIDSLSHAWAGEGGILDMQTAAVMRQKTANSYTAWREVTPEHNRLIETVLQSPAHIIATLRAKTDYVQEEVNGKKVVRKIGLAPIQRDGMEYEFTVFLDIEQSHQAVTSKDRTGLFDGQMFTIGEDTGKHLRKWLDEGEEPVAPLRPAQQPQQTPAVEHITKEQAKELVKAAGGDMEIIRDMLKKHKFAGSQEIPVSLFNDLMVEVAAERQRSVLHDGGR